MFGWNKQPVNFSFTVVSCKWRTGIRCEPSKLGNKCTISCWKVLKAISTHFRIIMHFKPICWNINTIMGKEINAQWEVSWRWHRVFRGGTRLNGWNRGVWGWGNNGDVVGKEVKLKQNKTWERPQLRGSKGMKICQRGLRDERLILASRDVCCVWVFAVPLCFFKKFSWSSILIFHVYLL